jgi:hypothetical protein
MPNYQAVSKDQHLHLRWQRFASYSFAAGQAVAPIVAGELAQTAVAMPIAFLPRGDGFTPAAVLGLEKDKNLFVAPNGRWLGGSVPAAFRGYPFALARREDGQNLLCVDMDSGLVTEGGDGEPFFDASGNPGQALQDVLAFLKWVSAGKALMEKACAALARQEVIEPWPITLSMPSGDKEIQGLFRIAEKAMNDLSDQGFLELRSHGALSLAYSQLISMQNIDKLRRLARIRAKAAQSEAADIPGGIDLDSDSISFS